MSSRIEIIKENDSSYQIASNRRIGDVRMGLSTIAEAFTSKDITIYGGA